MLCEKCDMMMCFKLFDPEKPLHGKCSECGHIQDVKFNEIPDYAVLITFDDFVHMCDIGAFIDYDGEGQLATKDKAAELYIKPSHIKKNEIFKHPKVKEIYTHVAWYNR